MQERLDKRGNPWWWAWAAVVLAAVGLSVLVGLEALPDEAGLVREVQASGLPGTLASDVARGVTAMWVLVAAGVFMVVMHLAMGARAAAGVLAVLLIAWPVGQAGIKELVDRPRPADAGIERRASFSSPSFPAGHVMGPTVVYGWAVVWLASVRPGTRGGRADDRRVVYVSRALAAVMAAVLALAGVVNVYLGVHWPTDAIGGYLWGLVLLLPSLVWARPAPD